MTSADASQKLPGQIAAKIGMSMQGRYLARPVGQGINWPIHLNGKYYWDDHGELVADLRAMGYYVLNPDIEMAKRPG